jgi:ATP-dependent Clp protease ATP-binding subunit ClpA
MALILDAEAQTARDLARRCVPEGGVMGMGVLLQALFHGSTLKDRFPQFGEFLPEPEEHRTETPEAVPLAASLKPVLTEIASKETAALTPETWFAALLHSEPGRDFALSAGIPGNALDEALVDLGGEGKTVEPAVAAPATVSDGGGWRESKERQQVVEALSTFGRMLTVGDLPDKGVVELDAPLEAINRVLVQRKQRNPLVIGLPGTGKSAVVYEFARMLLAGDPRVQERLRDHDIFELSPVFLRSGASVVGQYEERVTALLKILTANPKVILFVDEAHSMFQSGMDHRTPFSDANEAFKTAIQRGEISIIGCTTTAEYRHYIEPDTALKERFTPVTVEEPSPEKTKAIMRARLPMVEEFYRIKVPEELIDRTVQLTEEYLLGRAQPRKSIQLLDGACAYCITAQPPKEELTEDELWRALEDTIGHSLVRKKTVDPEEIEKELKSTIIGQDAAIAGITRAFVMGIKGVSQAAKKPRGVFMFSGPTGVGKTETTVLLSRILGGGKEAMLRVDCNTLKGSGHDGGPAQNVLFGPPPGYIGYVKGKGGVLSHIRDHPECIVLFDEIEKADPNVGELLFRIIDDGQCEDKEGNPLDFRRAFIVFTTNAGAVYEEEKSIGFGGDESAPSTGPRTNQAAMRGHFVRMGLGEAFLGRMTHFFDFRGLDDKDAKKILQSMMEGFAADPVGRNGYTLEWDQDVIDHLIRGWEPALGARSVAGVLRIRVKEPWILANLGDDLEGIETIRLTVLTPEEAAEVRASGESEKMIRENDTLVIGLA